VRNRGCLTVREGPAGKRLGCLRLGDRDGRKVNRRLQRVADELGQQQLRRQCDDMNLRRDSGFQRGSELLVGDLTSGFDQGVANTSLPDAWNADRPSWLIAISFSSTLARLRAI
jgi:hypothetical protein